MLEAFEHLRPHQEELRKRLIHCCLAIVLASAVAYLFKDHIAAWCMRPLYLAYPQLGKLVYTKLTEAFVSYLSLSLLVGLAASFPYVLYQIWLFISPGLLDQEKQLIRRIVLWATLLFAGGASFAFFIILPRMLHYFMSYASPTLTPMLKLGLYLTFTARMVLAFGIAFEIPFLMVMAVRSGLLNSDHFRKNRIYFYIAIVVLSFLLTTGELTATTLLSFPLFALYEAGIIAGRVFQGKKTPPAVIDSTP
jgi:sec-independent protein translocase protein TatC